MSKKQESAQQELTVAQATDVALAAQNLDAWGESPVSSRDIIIPKILAMQGLSELVTEGKAAFGDFVDSVSGEVLGSITKPLKFVPFYMEKVWIISSKKQGDQKFEFEKYEPVTPNNLDKPFTEFIMDREYKNEYSLQFYVLRPEDPSIPYVISFKSTSSRAGKILSTQMYVRNRAAGLTPASYVMELGGKKEKNDKGTFVVMETKPVEKTSPELLVEAMNWLQIIRQGGAKVAAEAPASASSDEYVSENVKF